MTPVSQGKRPARVCRPQTLAKMKTASISAQISRMLSRWARISPCRRMKALCAPTTANSPKPVAVPLAQAASDGRDAKENMAENPVGGNAEALRAGGVQGNRDILACGLGKIKLN